MTVEKLAVLNGFEIFNMGNPGQEVSGAYCGDLLSWVMGRAPEGSAWLTIMSNVNVAAVAVMADISCVIICEGEKPDRELYDRALSENISLFGSHSSVFEIAGQLYAQLGDHA